MPTVGSASATHFSSSKMTIGCARAHTSCSEYHPIASAIAGDCRHASARKREGRPTPACSASRALSVSWADGVAGGISQAI